MTIKDRIAKALAYYKAGASPAEPKRIWLSPSDYRELHAAAGNRFPLNPETEDERMEYKGMAVFQHQAQHIEFSL